jgi:hypothetical protein
LSVERHAGRIELLCDDCGEPYNEPWDAGDFKEMMAAAKSDGWRTFQRKGQWHNACPACVKLWVDGMKQQDMFGR